MVDEHLNPYHNFNSVPSFAYRVQFGKEKSYNVIVLDKLFSLGSLFICPLTHLINIYQVLAYYNLDIVQSPRDKEKEKVRQIKNYDESDKCFHGQFSVLFGIRGKQTKPRKEGLGGVSAPAPGASQVSLTSFTSSPEQLDVSVTHCKGNRSAFTILS